MADVLSADDVAAALKIDREQVDLLIENGVLHGVHDKHEWFTTHELLQGDLDLLTESSRAHRLRNGIVPILDPADGHVWSDSEWIENTLARLRETLSDARES